MAHAFDENGNKLHLWMTEEIAVGCVVILIRYATVMWMANGAIELWRTNSLRKRTYVPQIVRNELEKASFSIDMSGLPEKMDGD